MDRNMPLINVSLKPGVCGGRNERIHDNWGEGGRGVLGVTLKSAPKSPTILDSIVFCISVPLRCWFPYDSCNFGSNFVVHQSAITG